METFVVATQQAAEGALTEATARKLLDDILKAAGHGSLRSNTVREFLAEWLESKEAAKAKGTARRYRDVIDAFIKFLGDRAERALSSITPSDIQAFRDNELRLGKSNKTANLALKTLRIALNVARKQNVILTNPAEAVDILPDDSAERGAFSVADVQKLLAVAEDIEWRGLILVGATCGLRLGDAARLTWGNIDFEKKTIGLSIEKRVRGKRRKVETLLMPELEEYLLELPVRSKSLDTPLFPRLSKRPVNTGSGLSNTFSKMILKAGIVNDVAKEKQGSGRTVNRLSFHSFRHTCISIMANIGVAKELRMKLVGHTSNVHDRYTHHELQTYRDALKDFPRFNASPQGIE